MQFADMMRSKTAPGIYIYNLYIYALHIRPMRGRWMVTWSNPRISRQRQKQVWVKQCFLYKTPTSRPLKRYMSQFTMWMCSEPRNHANCNCLSHDYPECSATTVDPFAFPIPELFCGTADLYTLRTEISEWNRVGAVHCGAWLIRCPSRCRGRWPSSSPASPAVCATGQLGDAGWRACRSSASILCRLRYNRVRCDQSAQTCRCDHSQPPSGWGSPSTKGGGNSCGLESTSKFTELHQHREEWVINSNTE